MLKKPKQQTKTPSIIHLKYKPAISEFKGHNMQFSLTDQNITRVTSSLDSSVDSCYVTRTQRCLGNNRMEAGAPHQLQTLARWNARTHGKPGAEILRDSCVGEPQPHP